MILTPDLTQFHKTSGRKAKYVLNLWGQMFWQLCNKVSPCPSWGLLQFPSSDLSAAVCSICCSLLSDQSLALLSDSCLTSCTALHCLLLYVLSAAVLLVPSLICHVPHTEPAFATELRLANPILNRCRGGLIKIHLLTWKCYLATDVVEPYSIHLGLLRSSLLK